MRRVTASPLAWTTMTAAAPSTRCPFCRSSPSFWAAPAQHRARPVRRVQLPRPAPARSVLIPFLLQTRPQLQLMLALVCSDPAYQGGDHVQAFPCCMHVRGNAREADSCTRIAAGSCLLLQGNAAGMAMHCVPAVSQRRVTVTLCRHAACRFACGESLAIGSAKTPPIHVR